MSLCCYSEIFDFNLFCLGLDWQIIFIYYNFLACSLFKIFSGSFRDITADFGRMFIFFHSDCISIFGNLAC